jgi:DNA-binding beta-propeller fold protein YncE
MFPGRGTLANETLEVCRMRTRRLLLVFVCLGTTLPTLVAGQRLASREIVWPEAPAPARIRYIGQLSSEEDIGRKSGFFSKMRGKLAGTGGDSYMSVNRPHDVYVLGGKRFFVSDGGIGKVVLFDGDSKSAKVLGQSGEGRLYKPMGIGGDGSGIVYVADASGDRVVAFDDQGEFLRLYGGKGMLLNPVDVAVDVDRDRLYVVDSYLHQVVVFSVASGEVVGRIGRDEGDLARKQAIFAGIWSGAAHGVGEPDDGNDDPSLPDSLVAQEEVDLSREPRDLVANRGVEAGEFRYPAFIAVAPDGTLYVSDQMNFRVQAFDPEGTFLRQIGGQGVVPGAFARPKGVAVDSQGHVYVADAAFNNVHIFDREGRLLLHFADGGTDEGQIFLPLGLDIDEMNRVYIADRYNDRIQVFEFLPIREGEYANQGG